MAPFEPGQDTWVPETAFLTIVPYLESNYIRQALRFSLKATSRTSSLSAPIDDGPGPPGQRDPRFRKLVEGILYSRRFILNYHFVILGFIALVGVRHWSAKAIRWQRSKRQRPQVFEDEVVENTVISGKRTESSISSDSGFASSSSISSLEGTENLSQKTGVVYEGTALLQKHLHLPKSKPSQSSMWSYFQAFLIYQPPPLPVFLQKHKNLPSMGISIVVLTLICLNAFFTLHHINFNTMELFVLADRCGLVFVANLPLLYLCSAKTQPIKFLTGYSYESLNIFHRRLGEIMCFLAFVHALGMFGVWYTLLSHTGFTLKRFIFNKTILTGLGAFFAYELIYLTARPYFRHLWYELFLGLHVFLQAGALVFVFFHHSASRIYLYIVLAIFIVDRLLYRGLLKTTTIIANAVVMNDGETVRLSATFDLERRSILNRLIGITRGGWKAADHVFLTVPSLGRKHALQAHPFTIASAAATSDCIEGKLELLIRAQGGFSSDLLRAASQQISFTVRIDGPYGSDHARSLLADSEVAIVVAGGSGIAVAWPLINYLLDGRRSTGTRIASEVELRRQHIVLIWVVHRADHLSWIGRSELQDIDDKGVEVVIPQATEAVGRPDLQSIIEEIVMKAKVGKRIGVVGSGPDSMGRAVRNTCARLVRDGRDVDVTIEKFGW